MSGFAELQERLPDALAANHPGSEQPHVVVGLPSYSLGPTILRHYQPLLGPLEHRYLLAMLMLPRIPGEHMVVVTSAPPDELLLQYYARLADPKNPGAVRERISVVIVPDDGPRPVGAKLLDRPDLLAEIREIVGGGVGHIESWNVTEIEVAVATALGIPVNGTPPELWPLGFKSAGRRLFTRAGVPVACGREGVHGVEEIAHAVTGMRQEVAAVDQVVVKQDNSGYGDGNWVVSTRDSTGKEIEEAELARRLLDELPEWFVQDLEAGGVVEEMITGHELTSPSAQLEIQPDGEVHLLSTHEQLIGGSGGQTFVGCLFPARAEYAADLGRHALAIGKEYAAAGAVGRLAADFMAANDGDGWSLYALEVNLRKGGTTHPYTALRNLAPGTYDEGSGNWVADLDGRPRCYRSVDAFQDSAFVNLSSAAVVAAVADQGLEFDQSRGTGVVLHMLGGLAVDGRMGYIAIGHDRAEADELGARTEDVVRRLAAANV